MDEKIMKNNCFINGQSSKLTWVDILSRAGGDIAAISADHGINWDVAEPLINIGSSGIISHRTGIALTPKDRGKVQVRYSFYTTNSGYEHFTITFICKRHGEYKTSFNSYEWYQDNKHLLSSTADPVYSPRTITPKAKQAEKSANIANANNDYQYKTNRFNKVKAEFNSLPAATTPPLYFKKKGLTLDDLPDNFVLKCGNDSRGDYSIFALRNPEGNTVGYQKIYDKYFGGDDAPRNKDYIFHPVKDKNGNLSTLKNGSYAVLGKPENPSDLIYIVEGLTTGLSIYMATGSAVVVALDAGNLQHVAKAWATEFKNIIIAADNDIKPNNAGNPGLHAALKVANASNAAVKVVFPEFEGKKVDFDDIRQSAGLDAVRDQLNNNVLCNSKTSSLEYSNLFIKYAPKQQLKSVVELTARGIASNVFSVSDYKKKVKQVLSVLKERGIKLPTFFKLIRSNIKTRINRVNKKHCITNTEGVTVHDCDGLDNKDVIYQMLKTGGVWLDNRSMGAGKTQLMQELTDLTKALRTSDIQVTYMAHRTSLIASAANRLDLKHYEDVGVMFGESPSTLAVCINSIVKHATASNINVLFIDEFRQTLEHLLNGTVTDRWNVYCEFVETINNADLVICADADLNDFCIEWLKNHTNKPLHLAKTETRKNDKTITELPTHETTIDHACNEVVNGGNVWVTTDSTAQAMKMATMLGGYIDNKDILMLTAENKADVRQAAFLSNPGEESRKYRAIIHTPVISSGISIEHKHFSGVYAMFSNVITPNAMLQSVARVRSANQIYVSLRTNYSNDLSTDYRDLLDGEVLQRARYTGGLTVAVNQFDVDRAKQKATENHSLNSFNYKSEFFILAQIKGYTVKTPEVEAVKIKGLSAAVKEVIIDRAITAKKITAETAIELDKKQALKQSEANSLVRHKIERMAAEPINEENADFYINNNGASKIANYELLNADIEKLKDIDNANLTTRDRSQSLTSKAEFIETIVHGLKAKEFNNQSLDGFMQFLQDNHKELAANGLGDFKVIPKKPVSKLSNLLSRIGFDLVEASKTRDGRTYKIEVNENVKYYSEQRAKQYEQKVEVINGGGSNAFSLSK